MNCNDCCRPIESCVCSLFGGKTTERKLRSLAEGRKRSKPRGDAMTTLDDLKRAIEAVPELKPGVKAYAYQSARARSWRTACQWMLQYVHTVGNQYPEFLEGIRLMEKLK